MRVIIISLIFLCFINPFANAEGIWEVTHHVSGSDWQDVFFLDELHGWAVGYYGAIMSTTDGGKNWNLLQRNNTQAPYYYKCFFVSEKEGWVTGWNGEKGILFSTADGGKTLRKNRDYQLGANLGGIFFITKNEGWVIGSNGDSPFIQHTDNAGISWEDQEININGWLNTVFFIDNKKGFVVGTQKPNIPMVYKTDNGGRTWIKQSIPADTGSCWDVFFLNSLEGWISLYTSLLKTADGGTTWQKIDIPQGAYLLQARFKNSNEGIFIGYAVIDSMDYGLIMQTKDGCQSFDKQLNYSFINGVACSGDKYWIVGNDNTAIYSEDGKNWLPQIERAYTFMDVEFVGKNKGFIAGLAARNSSPVGDFVILSTDDGGDTWKEGDTHISEDWCCFDFLDGSTAWIGGSDGLYHTEDAGKTIQKDKKFSSPIYDISFSSNEDGWAIGNSALWQTSDGGKSWQDIKLDAQISFHDLETFGDKAYAVGSEIGKEGGIIIIAENGGKTIRKVKLEEGLNSVCFITDKKGWTVGYKGSIFATDDSGKTWDKQKSGTDVYLSDVLFLSEKEGWLIGGGGELTETVILHTLDGGKTWTKQDCPTREYMNKIVYSGDNHLFVVGNWGTILRYTDDSLSQYSKQFSITNQNSQPTTWGKIKNQLYQNYPNPFNPETWIPYYLSEDSNVVIKIQDTNGKLIRTLNLGHKSSGSYTTRDKSAYWDGKNEAGEHVSSGVYFYTINAGDFSAMKKMLIIR